MTDRIRIRDLHLRAVIGVFEWERKDRQDLHLDLELEADLARAGASDRIEDAVDYRAVTKAVIEHVESSRYALVERLATAVAELILGRFPAVSAVTVRVDKPGALRFARTVGVEIRRAR